MSGGVRSFLCCPAAAGGVSCDMWSVPDLVDTRLRGLYPCECVFVLAFDRGVVTDCRMPPTPVVVRLDDSMYSNTAVRSLSIVGHGRMWMSSFLTVAKNDSATALSKHEPVRPTDGRTPLR